MSSSGDSGISPYEAERTASSLGNLGPWCFEHFAWWSSHLGVHQAYLKTFVKAQMAGLYLQFLILVLQEFVIPDDADVSLGLHFKKDCFWQLCLQLRRNETYVQRKSR